MPKKKDLIRPKSKAKAKPKAAADPQSENDFLEAADEEEQGAGKWKAGDPAKATRFYGRAIDFYNAGLARYPTSFDLAYNKANLQYNLSEDDRLVGFLGNKISLLEETLQSHRFALTLTSDNTDVVFNTGQVLTSLAEEVLESGLDDSAKVPARSLLEEAVGFFTQCLDRQLEKYQQMEADFAKAMSGQEDTDLPIVPGLSRRGSSGTSSNASSTAGDWATVEEPLTPETILETCTAHLEALTTLLGLYDPSDLLRHEEKAQNGLETANTTIHALINRIPESPFTKVADEPAPGPTLTIGSTSKVEEPQPLPKDNALLSAAKFKASVAELQYRSKQYTTAQYATQLESIFSPLTQTPSSESETNPTVKIALVNALSGYADALIDLASAIPDTLFPDPSTIAQDTATQWTALSQAQAILLKLSTGTYTTTLSPFRLADIFLARGDIDLFRFRLATTDDAKSAWAQSKNVLVSNAGVLYRGARSYATKAGVSSVQKEADTKAIVAEVLKEASVGGGDVIKKEHWVGRSEDVVKVLEQMVEEGIVGKENAEGVMGFTL